MRVRYLIPFRYTEFGAQLLQQYDQTLTMPAPTLDPATERREHVGASAFSTIVTELTVDDTDTQVLVGRLGVGAAVVTVDIAGVDDIARLEAAVLHRIAAHRAEWVTACRAATGTTGDSGPSDFLWVHRILLLDRGESFATPMVPLDYGIAVTLSRGAHGVVGSGYSALWSDGADQIEAFTQGLFVATQAWTAYDALSEQSVRLLDEASDGSVAGDPAHLALTARRLRAFVRRLQSGLVDGRAATYHAAGSAWGIVDEHDSLIERADAYVEFVKLRAADGQARIDRRRNLLLFGLAFAALAQTIIAVYEASTGTATALGPPARVLVSLVAAAVALVGFCVGVVWALADKKAQDGSLLR